MTIPDGLRLRGATESDLEQICTLLAERGDEADAEDLLLVAHDPDEGLGSIAVVVDERERVVSTATLLREVVTIGGVEVPTGQVEMVATAQSHEGHGLVRRLMAWAHEESTRRGDLLQVMVGIPYFYRQFGYSYSMPIPMFWSVDDGGRLPPSASGDGCTVRRATTDDVPAIIALGHEASSGVDVRMDHSAACWRWLAARSGTELLVAETHGRIVASGRAVPPAEGRVLCEVSGSADGISALVAHVARAPGETPPSETVVQERPGTELDSVLGHIGVPPEDREREQEWFYARVPSFGPLLTRLAPLLVDRAREVLGGETRDVLLSTWHDHFRFTIGPDGMSEVEVGGPEQRPISKGGAAVPPDLLAPLLLGPFGADGLEKRHSDVVLGCQRDLMLAMFPSVTSSIETFYLAT